MKVCTVCKNSKDLKDFDKRSAAVDGLSSRCRSCKSEIARAKRKANPEASRAAERKSWAKHKERRRAEHRARYYANPEKSKNKALLRNFGITLEEYKQMLAEQRGVCASCGEPPQIKRLAVDHDHRTGRVRGLLCDLCNRGCGMLRDSPEIMRSLANYVEQFQELKQ